MKLLSAKEALTQSKLNRIGYIENRISDAIKRGYKHCTGLDLTKEELAQLKKQRYKVTHPSTSTFKITWENFDFKKMGMENITEINTKTEEGKLLVSAIAVIVNASNFKKTPDEIFKKLNSVKEIIYENTT